MPLRLLTLGAPLELIGPDGQPLKFTNTKHLALLAYLVLEPGEHTRSSLTRFVWSSADPGSFNDALSSLRAVFGKEVFPPRVQRITLDPSLVTCDAAEFATLEGQLDDPAARRAALALYRGPFFEDFNTRGASPRYIKWVEDKCAELERVFLAICERECQSAADEERWDDVAAVAAEAKKKAPAWEGAERWMELARQERLTPPPAPALVREVPEAPALTVPPAPPIPPAPREEHVPPAPAHRPPRRVATPVLLLLALGVLAAGVWFLRQGSDRAGAGEQRVASGDAASASAPVCQPGQARAQLVDEVFHYGVRVRPGRAFAKRWTLQNSGDCTWGTDFRLHHITNRGERLSAIMMDVPLWRQIPPGDTAAFVLPMKAPETPGRYEEVWELRDGGNRHVPVGSSRSVVAMIRVPLPHYPPCAPGQGAAVLIGKKYPDGTVLRPGETLRFSWTIKNDDECAWGDGTVLRYVASTGARVSRIDSVRATRSVEPGETYTFLAPMQMPAAPGVYGETWALRSGAGMLLPVDALPAVTVQLRIHRPEVPVTVAPRCPPGAAHVRFLDENWPDSSRVAPGQEFIKRWTVRNDGECAWPASYRLQYTSNTNGRLARSTDAKPLGEIVPPGAAYTFEVPMRGPRTPGFYREDWRFTDDRGELIMIGTAPYLAALITVSVRE